MNKKKEIKEFKVGDGIAIRITQQMIDKAIKARDIQPFGVYSPSRCCVMAVACNSNSILKKLGKLVCSSSYVCCGTGLTVALGKELFQLTTRNFDKKLDRYLKPNNRVKVYLTQAGADLLNAKNS